MTSKTATASLLLASAALLLPAALEARSVQPPGSGDGTMVTFMTYNMQWGLYYNLEGERQGVNLDYFVDLIGEYSPDFVGLQEVHEEEQAAELAERLGMNYHFGYMEELIANRRNGNAVLTPHPIHESRTYHLPNEEEATRNVVEILSEVDGQPIRVYSTHLNFNNHPAKPRQYMAILDVIAQRTEPRILMGDFNDMDDRPNEYSALGFINLVTGAGHGTILPSAPKMYDVHRKVAIDSQVRNDPPYYSLRTDWDPPAREANSINGWEPRVRIDYIFASPEFHLDAPGNKAWVIDTREVTARLYPEEEPVIISDHRPVYAELLLPKPVEELFRHPQEGPTVLTAGESRVIHAGGIDGHGSPVSLMRTDHGAPLGDPSVTARIIDGVTWTYEGEGGELTPIDPLEGYDAFIRGHRPSASAVRFTATGVGEGKLTATIDDAEASLDIKIIAEGERYVFSKD